MTALRRKSKQRGHSMGPLDLPAVCDVCNKGRSHGNHTKCSAIRKQRAQEKAS